nr:MAG TPA: hypothetical protein [Caudoviricetes sp.]
MIPTRTLMTTSNNRLSKRWGIFTSSFFCLKLRAI